MHLYNQTQERQDSVVASFTPSRILVASAAVQHPAFAQKVIFSIRGKEPGTWEGLALNAPILKDLTYFVAVPRTQPDGQTKTEVSQIPLRAGGPVNSDRNFLMAFDPYQESVYASSRLCLGSGLLNADAAMAMFSAQILRPENLFPYRGCYLWKPGQLENEINLGVWHILPFRCELVFAANRATLWQQAMQAVHTKQDPFRPLLCASCGMRPRFVC